MEMGGEGHSHGHDHAEMAGNSSIIYEPTYFNLTDHSGLIYAHIALSILAWCFILPISVMLSLAKSRFTPFAQLSFLAVNGAGLFSGFVYNVSTPDLYEHNAHHIFGWIVTGLMIYQTVLGFVRLYTSRPTPTTVFVHTEQSSYQKMHHRADRFRWSRDSGHGTDASSSRDSSPVSPLENGESGDQGFGRSHSEEIELDGEYEKNGLLGDNAVDSFISRNATKISNSRSIAALNLVYGVIDRLILIMGFVAILTGIATYGGFFKGGAILSGLAHFIKGGIFMWLGFLALGRTLGSFADIGWAWNVKPSAEVVGQRKANTVSAEFFESFLIFFYGITNVFLEHLEGGEWSATDLEHVSITILFAGGGLCGMLIESKTVRSLLNETLFPGTAITPVPHNEESSSPIAEPRSYGFSLNPLPAIVITLLGSLMSGHHQVSMVSTMLHAQWGTLFLIGSVARGITYITMWLKPPTSILPSRPPSEFIVAFCLIGGGIMFMCSNSDFVGAMENRGLNAMFLFTIGMGLTTTMMSWEIVCLTVKAWAARRERRAALVSRV